MLKEDHYSVVYISREHEVMSSCSLDILNNSGPSIFPRGTPQLIDKGSDKGEWIRPTCSGVEVEY